MRRAGTLLRGCAALLTLTATTIGLPVLLFRLGGSPIPGHVPSWHELTFALLHRDNGTLFLGAVRDISWLAWSAFTVAVLAEAEAALRGRPAPRMHVLGLQGAAAKLVAVASVTFTTPTAFYLAAAPAMAAPAAFQAHARPVAAGAADLRALPASASQQLTLDALAMPAEVAVHDSARAAATPHDHAAHRIVVVLPGDCLWTIAAHYLGLGDRYPVLIRLNLGHDMGDGQVFTDPSLIMPGWKLTLPGSAAGGTGGSPSDPHPQPGQHHGHPSGNKHFRDPHTGAGGQVRPCGRRALERVRVANSGERVTLAAQGRTDDPDPPSRRRGSRRRFSRQCFSRLECSLEPLWSAWSGSGTGSVSTGGKAAGSRCPLTPTGQRIESKLRAAAPPAPQASLRDALCDLSTGVAEGGDPLPPIVGIHLTRDSIDVLLSAPAAGPPPPPFSIAPGRQGMCWTTTLTDVPSDWATSPPMPGEVGDLLPGLFTAGATDGGFLLLDLEAMRVTCCDGPAELTDRLLVTAATELAASRWSGWYELILAGCDELDVLGRADRCRDLDEALDVLETRVATIDRRLRDDRQADVRTRRMEDPEDEDWGLTLLVSRLQPTADQMARLLDLSDGPGGIAALVAGDTQAADGQLAPAVFRLEADPDGPGGMVATITLAYLGPHHQLTVRPQTLTVPEYLALAGLFATAAGTSDVSPDAAPYEEAGGPPWMHFAAAPIMADLADAPAGDGGRDGEGHGQQASGDPARPGMPGQA